MICDAPKLAKVCSLIFTKFTFCRANHILSRVINRLGPIEAEYIEIMQRIILLVAALAVLAVTFSCGGSGSGSLTGGGESPTEAYKRLFKAVKSKDVEAIKAELSVKSIEFAKMAAGRNNTPIEKVFENGFTATTMNATLPEIRDQRIAENMGAVEVYNAKDSRWEDLPFVLEDGKWKLAVGDLFAGSFKSPGKGRDAIEKEAANVANPNLVQAPAPNTSANANIVPIVPKPAANSVANSVNPVPKPANTAK